jgi:hypothetical protein
LQKGEQVEIAKCEKEPPAVLEKGLEVIASSLSLIGHTVGLAIEVGVSLLISHSMIAVISICLDGKPWENVLASLSTCIQMKIF